MASMCLTYIPLLMSLRRLGFVSRKQFLVYVCGYMLYPPVCVPPGLLNPSSAVKITRARTSQILNSKVAFGYRFIPHNGDYAIHYSLLIFPSP